MVFEFDQLSVADGSADVAPIGVFGSGDVAQSTVDALVKEGVGSYHTAEELRQQAREVSVGAGAGAAAMDRAVQFQQAS